MFGGQQIEHDRRYEMAGEFTDILCRLWSEREDLTLQGRFWSLEKAFVTPKPRYGRPVLVNATGSPAGIEYAATHSDLIFITSPAGHEIDAALAALPAHNAAVKAAGAKRGRELRTIINPTIVCRETDREAQRYHQAIVDAADNEAIKGFVAHQRHEPECSRYLPPGAQTGQEGYVAIGRRLTRRSLISRPRLCQRRIPSPLAL